MFTRKQYQTSSGSWNMGYTCKSGYKVVKRRSTFRCTLHIYFLFSLVFIFVRYTQKPQCHNWLRKHRRLPVL